MDEKFFNSLPKVEIHTHLEGTMTPKVLHEIAKKNSSESQYAQSLEACMNLYNFTDFPGFLRAFSESNSYLQNVTDIDILLKNNIINSLHKENYKYVEYFISIDTFLKKNLSLIEILDKLKLNCKKHKMIGGFIIDFVRNYGPENASKILNELKPIIDDYRDVILGISIGGDELNFPSPVFKKVFEEARSLDLKTTAHAGEAAGSQAIWDTILNLKTDRIGHGFHAYESKDLIKHLRVTQTPLEICPTSNVKTGIVDDLKNHPLQFYYSSGLKITINTDDSGFFSNSLSGEFENCSKLFEFDEYEIKQLVLNAAQSCFCDNFSIEYLKKIRYQIYDNFSKKELIEELKIKLEN